MCAAPTNSDLVLISNRRLFWVGCLIGILSGCVTPAASGEEARPPSQPEVSHFRSGDCAIKLECYSPNVPGKHPALVVLHAVDGINKQHAGFYSAAARAYSERGYVVLLVHYFDRTGATEADLREYRKLFYGYFQQQTVRAADQERMATLFGVWTETVRDAVAHARQMKSVDGDRIGLVGFSLGGGVALNTAARPEVKVAALVEFFGAPATLRERIDRLPPTLVFHGDEDGVVPVDQVYLLIGTLVARKQVPEVEIFRGVGHLELSLPQSLAAKLRTDAFLDNHLRPGDAGGARK